MANPVANETVILDSTGQAITTAANSIATAVAALRLFDNLGFYIDEDGYVCQSIEGDDDP